MFENLTWTHLAIIAAVGLLVFGPDRLPGAIRRSAAALRQLRAQLAEPPAGCSSSSDPSSTSCASRWPSCNGYAA
ncbi:MAG TPA: twin-arginine translocase TatA/TatE family subunit [Mycobacterium sp.]